MARADICSAQNVRRFLDYALKRLACCPYGEDKPVCGSCKIHCYKPAERETARQVMRWAGPRLIFSHPLMAVSHVVDKLVHKAPDTPSTPPGLNRQ